jgi:hypothetical protein
MTTVRLKTRDGDADVNDTSGVDGGLPERALEATAIDKPARFVERHASILSMP